MRVNPYLITSGIIFVLVAGLHVLRLFHAWPVSVGTLSIPAEWSWAGLAVAAGMAAWAIVLLRQRQ